jgi:hypothetical protein
MRLTMTLAAAAAALVTALPALAQTTSPSADASAASSAAPPATSPSAAESGAAASTTAATPTLRVGQPVKDKTGLVIGQIAELKPGAAGQTATVKMGDQSFAIGAESFVVQNGAAVINATQAELKSMIASAAKPG